jgi:antitoxin (DNA-binding transcriptional repressor) of toxin-antitoxin stability system
MTMKYLQPEARNAMIEVMATVRITEDELARDIHAVLAKVQEGVEVIVEQDHRPVAVIKTPKGPGRNQRVHSSGKGA